MVRSSAQGIGSSIFLPLPVDNLEVEFGKEFWPPGLTFVEVLGCSEIGQVFVIGIDSDLVIGSAEIGFPFLECLNNSYKFLVMDLVIEFGSIKLLREEGNRVK